jgi:SAM-dependent methyltransferase
MTIASEEDLMMEQTSEQAQLWNGAAGRAWVEAQELLDELFAPFEWLLVEAAAAAAPAAVLDVGCGTGATTLALARQLGVGCTGVDLSEPMLATARARADREQLPVRFVHADAGRHRFPPGHFDAIVSRFGVMFFDDPVGAFANLRAAAADGAELQFVAWRDAAENPFMTTAEHAVGSLLPELPARRPDAPGQFAFADRERVAAILEGGGWSEVEFAPLDVVCALPEAQLTRYLSLLGPVGLALQRAEPAQRPQIVATARAAFEPFVDGDEVRFTAACWSVRARAGAER